MEENKTFAIGDRVDQVCLACGKERGHIIASLSKTGRITRVTCPMCNSRVPYRSGSTRKASVASPSPYDRATSYRRGQTLLHPIFGEGEVTAIIEPAKMDVLFADRIRRLIHAQ
jgi:DNA-directed RNA polymerase subunit RPC12/RpoP